LLWISIAVLRGWIPFHWMACPTILAAVVILFGSVFGREFFSVEFGPLPITIDRILWIWMLGQFFVLILMQRIRPLAINALDVLVIGLGVLLVISTLAHDYTDRGNLPLTRLIFFNLMPMGIYFVARHSPINERQLDWILYGLIGFASYLAVTAIAESIGWSSFVFPAYIMDERYPEFLGRGRGPFLNPVATGIYQIVGCAAAITVWARSGPRGRIAIAAAIALIAAGVFATFTRSVWMSLALSVSLAIWLPASTRRRGALLIVGATAAALFVAVFADQINSFKRDRDVTEAEMAESVQLRPLLAQVAFKMFADRPLFGHGFGQYSQAKRLYHQQVSDQPLKKVLPYMQHNVVLSYMTELGLVGTSLLLGIAALFTANSWRLFRRSEHPSARRAMGLLGLIMLIATFVNGMFHDVSIIPMVGSLFYFFAGLTNYLHTTSVRSANVTPVAQYDVAISTTGQRRAS
jgi:O-antigen ligase